MEFFLIGSLIEIIATGFLLIATNTKILLSENRLFIKSANGEKSIPFNFHHRINPAIVAVRRFARVPPATARKPSAARSFLLSGARGEIPPI